MNRTAVLDRPGYPMTDTPFNQRLSQMEAERLKRLGEEERQVEAKLMDLRPRIRALPEDVRELFYAHNDLNERLREVIAERVALKRLIPAIREMEKAITATMKDNRRLRRRAEEGREAREALAAKSVSPDDPETEEFLRGLSDEEKQRLREAGAELFNDPVFVALYDFYRARPQLQFALLAMRDRPDLLDEVLARIDQQPAPTLEIVSDFEHPDKLRKRRRVPPKPDCST